MIGELKQEKIGRFRDWLDMNDIDYQECANGHFQLYKGNQIVFQAWATTEKLAVPDGEMIHGMHNMLPVILEDCAKPPIKRAIRPDINDISDCRQRFMTAFRNNKGNMYDCILVVAVHLPTGATEIITNHYEVESKMEYYIEKYDDQFKLKANPKVQITGFMLV